MNAFVINLDSRPDKLELFYKNGIPLDVERFSGIVDTPGDNGCAKSHLSLISQQTKFPFAVFEDDCVLLQPWELVDRAMLQLPRNWDALWLGATLYKPIKRYSENLCVLKGGLALHAVIYNSKRMIDYVIENFKVTQQKCIIDLFYSHQVQDRFHCFIVHPLMATQRPGLSDITGIHVDYYQEIIDRYEKFTNDNTIK